MGLNLLYILSGILTGVAILFGAMRELTKHLKGRVEARIRHNDALERNTDATERLSAAIDKIGDVVTDLDKRVDKLEYKVWGFNGASHR